jgi:hypothetical protein
MHPELNPGHRKELRLAAQWCCGDRSPRLPDEAEIYTEMADFVQQIEAHAALRSARCPL